jgi:hypothetical protein
MYRCVLAAVTALCLVAPAAAQVQRSFPQNALRGSLTVDVPPAVTLNGQPAQLAPGARIRGQQNMLEMSGALIGAKLLVNYTLDNQGLVKDVWILTPDEAARKPWPTTPLEAQSWSFDPVAQVWVKP